MKVFSRQNSIFSKRRDSNAPGTPCENVLLPLHPASDAAASETTLAGDNTSTRTQKPAINKLQKSQKKPGFFSLSKGNAASDDLANMSGVNDDFKERIPHPSKPPRLSAMDLGPDLMRHRLATQRMSDSNSTPAVSSESGNKTELLADEPPKTSMESKLERAKNVRDSQLHNHPALRNDPIFADVKPIDAQKPPGWSTLHDRAAHLAENYIAVLPDINSFGPAKDGTRASMDSTAVNSVSSPTTLVADAESDEDQPSSEAGNVTITSLQLTSELLKDELVRVIFNDSPGTETNRATQSGVTAWGASKLQILMMIEAYMAVLDNVKYTKEHVETNATENKRLEDMMEILNHWCSSLYGIYDEAFGSQSGGAAESASQAVDVKDTALEFEEDDVKETPREFEEVATRSLDQIIREWREQAHQTDSSSKYESEGKGGFRGESEDETDYVVTDEDESDDHPALTAQVDR
ncbi:hypothetical protein QBC46DRAFT_390872 [Diplogelasinospora grovesii]|uniref:Uncharacterized protein n=1 Tax=Diplogelasinospora grovesii TaxID=303347 RepID=A0AAN6N4A6_9PEZI|nr:hypothetical protein QBC46DRAFT_390872 [Diplogelasinospora grovesii]